MKILLEKLLTFIGFGPSPCSALRPTPDDTAPEKSDEAITLLGSDSCFERSRKILKCAGLVDRVGLSDRMAEAVEAYRKMDLEAGKNSSPNAEAIHGEKGATP